MSNDLDERVIDEIEALEAILMDELLVKTNESGSPATVETKVFPSTADDTLQQYVCVTLVVDIPPGYPDVVPNVQLRNPRGLDDSVIIRIEKELKEKCSNFCGQPVIYELIELIREHLTESNLPSCHCTICLYGFQKGDQFTKTHCYHYFHSHCLATYIRSTEAIWKEEQEKLPAWQRENQPAQVVCPVCREPIECDADELSTAPPPLEVEKAAARFEATHELRSLQQSMAKLYLRQKQRGGIIDPERDDSKLLLVTEHSSEDESTTMQLPGPSLNRNHSGNSTGRGAQGHGHGHGHTRGSRGGWRGRRGHHGKSHQSSTPAASATFR